MSGHTDSPPPEHEQLRELVIRYRSPHGLEQSRRNFMADHPELYRYITMRETAKAFDLAGDEASGATSGHEAANRIWRLEARAKTTYKEMIGK